ncbi:MAG: hypothetical protein LBL59_01740 [Xanthomonadaceae bacterium]|jgi:hypothetical protein|nr:hypothetical protein [Xanthomonadaceae bacterium]
MQAIQPGKHHLQPQPKHLLLVGAIANLAIFSLPLVRYMFGYYSVFVHELGHAGAAWAFGYPAIPVFNFVHGGGYTMYFGPFWLLRLALLGLLGVYCRRWVKAHQGRLPLIMVLFWMAYLPPLLNGAWFRSIFDIMGHAGELMGAMLFCYCALSPHVKRPIFEKYLMIVLGIFMYMHSLHFCYQLCFDAEFIGNYLDPDSGIINDLVKLRDNNGWPFGFSVLLLLAINSLTLYWLVKLLRDYPYNVFGKAFRDFKKTLLARN